MRSAGRNLWTSAATAIVPAATGGDAVDPASVARDVFQGPDFWWKQIEPTADLPSSWLRSLARAAMELLARALGALWELILKVLRFLFGRFVGGTSGGSILVWLLVAAILAFALWKLVPPLLRFFGREETNVAEPGVIESESLADEADLRGQAAGALHQGQHAEAIRLALLALIAALEKRGLLRYDPTRTNREYRAELRPLPELSERFARLARIYEAVWYGRLPASREEAEESIRLCETPIDREALAAG